jgi:hypothetical protein
MADENAAKYLRSDKYSGGEKYVKLISGLEQLCTMLWESN